MCAENCDCSYPYDEGPEITPEALAERESEEAFSLHGMQVTLRDARRIQAFAQWWQERGRHMSRPLQLDL